MRKSYLRGTWLTLFFAILFVLMSIGGIQSFYDDRTKSAEVQYKEGKQFQKSSGYTFIKVEALEELDITDDSLKDNQKFYMLQHEHGFVMLKASKEDVKKLIQSNDIPNEKLIDLKDKNIYSRVNAIFERESKWEKLNISPELKEKFENSISEQQLSKITKIEKILQPEVRKTINNSQLRIILDILLHRQGEFFPIKYEQQSLQVQFIKLFSHKGDWYAEVINKDTGQKEELSCQSIKFHP